MHKKPYSKLVNFGPGKDRWENFCSAGEFILDCIYDEKMNTFFILDMIMWKNQEIFTMDSMTRFFFLENSFCNFSFENLEILSMHKKTSKDVMFF